MKLLYMMPDNSNRGYLDKFDWVFGLVMHGETREHVRARLEFAARNGYDTRIREMEGWISHG